MNEAPHTPERLGVAAGIHRAVEIARREAATYITAEVDTEHLLLGLLQERKRRKNIVSWCLEEFGITLRKVRAQVERRWEPDREAAEEVEFPFTPRLRDLIDHAKREARRLDHGGIEPTHLLLGLLEEPEGGAAQIFRSLDVDRGQARRTVMRLLDAED
jgi:ATP-dependent Clp protease ATP-binding subunit ClpC